ncbi:N-acetylmuramoyl-L-alanine amidase [Carnobacterium funditum]|uniref:N-acetylmuramoyl-L-alanine amidase n=1 Tax=Carnobacterium funditum TaxID=2752 RepID=UPI00054F7C77|nr:N-acetylmuramoyl-L-alanine amidase [Carnobacterium funditum]
MKKIDELKQQKNLIVFLAIILFISITAFSTIVLANKNTVKVDASVVNIRTGPGLSYDIMTQVVGGEKINILTEENEWYKIRLSNDQIGWVASWLIGNTEFSAASNKLGKISVETANIRSEGNLEATILGKATKGTELTVLFQQNNWTQIQYNGQVAWVSSDLIEITAEKKSIIPTSITAKKNEDASIETVTVRSEGTNIRNGPSINDTILYKASKGDNFTYLSTKGEWYKVKNSDGKTGYVANWVVDLSGNKTAAPSANITSLAEATIVIDAGHGGEDPGAPASNYNEKQATLKTAIALSSRLKQAGVNVILTRNSDEFVSLNQRTVTSNQVSADAFISIHYDSTEIPNEVSGTTTYYYHENDKNLAETINKQLQVNNPLPNNGTRFGDYYVLRENSQPAVLLELGYLNHTVDQATIYTDSYSAFAVESIYQALNNYFSS